MRNAMTVGNDGKPSMGVNFSLTDTLPAIEDIFNGLYEFITGKKKQAVVVFDEFQQIGELEDTRIEKILRGIIQNHRDISYIFMGSKKHLIYDMFNNPGRPFFKSSPHFPIQKIDTAVFAAFLKKKFDETNRPIDDKTALYIVETAESHPYYTQFLSHTVWEMTEPGQSAGTEIVDAAVVRILARKKPRSQIPGTISP